MGKNNKWYLWYPALYITSVYFLLWSGNMVYEAQLEHGREVWLSLSDVPAACCISQEKPPDWWDLLLFVGLTPHVISSCCSSHCALGSKMSASSAQLGQLCVNLAFKKSFLNYSEIFSLSLSLFVHQKSPSYVINRIE